MFYIIVVSETESTSTQARIYLSSMRPHVGRIYLVVLANDHKCGIC